EMTMRSSGLRLKEGRRSGRPTQWLAVWNVGRGRHHMGFVGLEEIFLKVQDLDRAIDFYHKKLGIPLDKHDQERAYLQCDRAHLVLQIENSAGRHQAGGPMHFAFTVTEDTFDQSSRRSPPRSIGHADRSSARNHSKAGRCSSLIRMGTKRKLTPATFIVPHCGEGHEVQAF